MESEITKLLNHLEETDEPIKRYLGVYISVEEGTMDFSQKTYIRNMLRTFSVVDCKTYTTLVTASFFNELQFHTNDLDIDKEPYWIMIGGMQFVSCRSLTL